MYELPTLAQRSYRGKYPHRVHSSSYSDSPSQRYLCEFLGIRRAIHLELNCGRRFIADIDEVRNGMAFVTRDIQEVLKKHPTSIIKLTQERYDEMLAGMRKIRGY